MRNPKTAIAADKSTFIQTTKTAKPKSHDTKTMRIPQNELLDLIYACFRRYRYWPFKALKAELKQPEAYLKQTLEMVAHLVRSGNFAMTWELKPEARESNYAEIMAANQGEHGQLAPSSGFDDGGETAGEAGPEEDEDGDVKFENVM
ncbi:hypothetical protein KEM55_004802 [Ascosphaera atra]|nr:hypothetical protein KEM55_004802 [Ascosphaera atra]